LEVAGRFAEGVKAGFRDDQAGVHNDHVTEIIIWLEQNFAPIAREKKLGFKLYFAMKETLFVHSDIGLLKSALINLVANAIKYTSKGALLISARRRGGNVLFQVWDTGIGISEEYVEHIFDEFYQIGNSQRDRANGLGLGCPSLNAHWRFWEEKSAAARNVVTEQSLGLLAISRQFKFYFTTVCHYGFTGICAQRFICAGKDICCGGR